jgi:hypothetical protein
MFRSVVDSDVWRILILKTRVELVVAAISLIYAVQCLFSLLRKLVT